MTWARKRRELSFVLSFTTNDVTMMRVDQAAFSKPSEIFVSVSY
jgi:hypothetical protein